MSVPEKFERFSPIRRFEHWVMVASFTALAFTGLPQKYMDLPISLAVLRAVGGLETARVIHRVAAVILMLISMVHIGSVLHDWYVKRLRASIMLGKQDLIDAIEYLRYNLGLRPEPPKMGWFTFDEKIEYWSLMWGTLIMVLTGFFLWNPITAARLFPGEWIPAAKTAHGSEALLAVLAILIWHTYHVHLKHFNKSMFTGYLTREEVAQEHPLVLEHPPQPAPFPATERHKRQRTFLAVYLILCLLWLGGVTWFVTVEQTATSAPEPIPDIAQVEAFAQLTPTPLPQPANLEEATARYGTTWEGGIGALLSSKCGRCHTPRLGARHLDLTTYAGALAGGDSGPAVVPNSPGSSLVLIWPNLEDHPAHLTPLERAAVWRWIVHGAPER